MANGSNSGDTISGIPGTFTRLRSFEGEPGEFWPKFLCGLIDLAKAGSGGILMRSRSDGRRRWCWCSAADRQRVVESLLRTIHGMTRVDPS